MKSFKLILAFSTILLFTTPAEGMMRLAARCIANLQATAAPIMRPALTHSTHARACSAAAKASPIRTAAQSARTYSSIQKETISPKKPLFSFNALSRTFRSKAHNKNSSGSSFGLGSGFLTAGVALAAGSQLAFAQEDKNNLTGMMIHQEEEYMPSYISDEFYKHHHSYWISTMRDIFTKAIYTSNVATIKEIIASDKNAINGSVSVPYRKLVSKSDGTYAITFYRTSPLMFAIHIGNQEMMKLLISLGADVNAKIHSDYPLLDHRQHQLTTARAEMYYDEHPMAKYPIIWLTSALEEAVNKANIEHNIGILKILLDAGARDPQAFILALEHAQGTKRPTVVQEFLNRGPEVFAPTKDWFSPLEKASSNHELTKQILNIYKSSDLSCYIYKPTLKKALLKATASGDLGLVILFGESSDDQETFELISNLAQLNLSSKKDNNTDYIDVTRYAPFTTVEEFEEIASYIKQKKSGSIQSIKELQDKATLFAQEKATKKVEKITQIQMPHPRRGDAFSTMRPC